MSMLFRRLLVCLLWLWLPVSQAADSGWLRAADNQHASVRLRAQTESNGDTRLLLDVALEKGWKTYWRSPGEGGIAPTIAWGTPLAVDWRWPTPQRFDVAGISTQGYHGDVSFPMTLRGKIPPTLSGVLTLSTCSNVCILTDYPFSLDMTAPPGEGFAYDYTRAMGTLPLRDGLTSQLNASYVSGKLTVTARRDAGWQQPALFIDSMEDVDFGKPSFTTRGDTLTASVPVTDSWGEAAPDLRGKTLSLVLADSGQAQESQLAIRAGSAAPGAALGWVLLMALAGGLILNVMPCVLPVLAMKLGSLVQTEHRERGAVRRQFLASACGIVVSFLALALMMTALRLGNQALGWGIQFQNPWFIGAMALVMVLFSASLLGLFEIRLSSTASTFLATRAQRLNGPFLAGRLRHPAGDTLHRAVPRHRRVGGAGGAAAAAVGDFLRHGDRYEPAVAADRRLAGAGATPSAPRPLDESSAGGAGGDDAGLGAMAGQPADDPHRPYPGAYPAGDTDRSPAAGHRLALPLADSAARRGSGHRGWPAPSPLSPGLTARARAATGLTGSRSASRLSPAPWRNISGCLLMSPPTGA